jgi:pimeloyl-ACP methyl ester carboxylesterase
VKKKFWVLPGVLAGLLLLLTGIAWLYDGYASRQALLDYHPPGQFVTVNDARMHYICQGKGEPTLVFEAGFDGGALDWMPILPALSKQHRVCAFDRLGQDWSDPASHPRTFGTAADELHTALQTLGITRPVVVGHSLGGALVQIYAAKYEVAGVVLVEGLTSDVAELVTQRLGSYQALNPLAPLGLLRPLGMLGADFAYPPELRKEMTALRSRSSALLNLTDEGALATGSAAKELRAAEANLSGRLLVISAEQSDVPGLPEGAFVAAEKALAARIANSQYVAIPGATHHYIMADHSQAVIDAIETWLANLK